MNYTRVPKLFINRHWHVCSKWSYVGLKDVLAKGKNGLVSCMLVSVCWILET